MSHSNSENGSGTALAVRSPDQPGGALTAPVQTPAPNALAPSTQGARVVQLLRPLADAALLVQAQREAREFMKAALKEGRDYGKTPGIEKPSLYKPGAEKFNKAYGLVERFTVLEKEVDHDREVRWTKRRKEWYGPKGQRRFRWLEESGVAYGMYRYVMMCELVDLATGEVRGRSMGSCSTLESKYVDRPRDLENTIIKMAQKRAYVGSTLHAHALSDEFTQDVEDIGVEAGDQEPAAPEEEVGTPAPERGSVLWAKEFVLPEPVQQKYGGKKTVGELSYVELTALKEFAERQLAKKPDSQALKDVKLACELQAEWIEDQSAFDDDDKKPASAEVGAPTTASNGAGAGAGSDKLEESFQREKDKRLSELKRDMPEPQPA